MSSQTQDTSAPKDVVTTIRIPSDQHRALTDIAKANHRSFVGELRAMIDERLAAVAEIPEAA